MSQKDFFEMSASLQTDGFEIIRSVVSAGELTFFRKEAERLSGESETACLRHLRKRSDVFNLLAISDTFRPFLPPGFIPVRSILFDKTPEQNWPVAWHQDLTIVTREKRELSNYGPWSVKDGFHHVHAPASLLENMITLRLHLDDASETNGALRVMPGSHLLGKIPSEKIASLTKAEEMICACRAGDLLLMKPLILHSSKRSEFPEKRRVIHFEYARETDLHESLEWAEMLLKSRIRKK